MGDRRLYAQFTLDYADSHKIAPLSDAAFRAHVRMILWSRRMLTDGRIPAAMALVLANRRPKVLAELTSNDADAPSLRKEPNGDYVLHDFLDHQSSRAHVEARQETNRANGAKGGQAKAQRTGSESVAKVYTETKSETETPTRTQSVSPVSESASRAATTDDRVRRRQVLAGLGITNFDRILVALARHVDRPLSEPQAVQIVTGILSKPKDAPRKPQQYVEGAIEKSWAEIQQLIDEAPPLDDEPESRRDLVAAGIEPPPLDGWMS